jgi:hypothetical protein
MIDPFATAHLGVMRSTVPVRGTAPQLDTLFDAHLGWVALIDPAAPRVDDSFCVALASDFDFAIATGADDSFCVARSLDEAFDVATSADDSFCVVLVDDDEVQL